MERIVTRIYDSPVGQLMLGSIGQQLCLCDWNTPSRRMAIDKRLHSFFGAEFAEGDSPTIQMAIQQLEEYFASERQTFDIPLAMAGTKFQQRVWEQLQSIPYGSTISYAALARGIGNPRAVRAVAAANGANAISIFVPCHRVIGSAGQLVGYAGGLEAKKTLLRLENHYSSLFS